MLSDHQLDHFEKFVDSYLIFGDEYYHGETRDTRALRTGVETLVREYKALRDEHIEHKRVAELRAVGMRTG